MGRPRIYANDSEKKAAYRVRKLERFGARAYRYSEAEKKAAQRARLQGDTGAATNSYVRVRVLRVLLDQCRNACWRMGIKRRWNRDKWTDMGAELLSAMLNEIEGGLEKAKRSAPGLGPELDALLDQCQQVRKHHIHVLDLACVFADVEDRLNELAGRKKTVNPELDMLSDSGITFRDYRAQRKRKPKKR